MEATRFTSLLKRVALGLIGAYLFFGLGLGRFVRRNGDVAGVGARAENWNQSPSPPAPSPRAGSISTAVNRAELQGSDEAAAPGRDDSTVFMSAIAVDRSGDLLIADVPRHTVRRAEPSGAITRLAGSGDANREGRDGSAWAISLIHPSGITMEADGSAFISDEGAQCIRKVEPNGTVRIVAGNGRSGYSGDGGPAVRAELSYPGGVAVDAAGNLFIADSYNHRIRRVSRDGTMTTVVGNGKRGYSGDGGPASKATLDTPVAVALDRFGGLYVVDKNSNRIRRVGRDGTIQTMAGNGERGFSGDGGPAVMAALSHPGGLALDSSGDLFIADTFNDRIREVFPNGTIRTVAGGGVKAPGDADGGPATEAALSAPTGVAVDASGNLFVADNWHDSVRVVFGVAAGRGPALGGF